eukprot:1207192-Ditylum_brightwellii.AAC.1
MTLQQQHCPAVFAPSNPSNVSISSIASPNPTTTGPTTISYHSLTTATTAHTPKFEHGILTERNADST